MNIVLLSGGSGARLWPISNEARSKQFLRLLKDENDNPMSMIQRVYKQIRETGYSDNIIISTCASQTESITMQLDDKVDLVVEPERRNTFPAIALTCAYLHYEKRVDKSQVVVILPVDPWAGIHYFHKLKDIEQALLNSKHNICLMGVHPTYPSEKYGYMIPNTNDLHLPIKRIQCFKEKPNQDQATKLILQGALWNCGVFAFRLGYIIEISNNYISASCYEDVLSQYNNLPKNSFDYEVIENESSICAVEYTGEWKDLGTWNTFTEQMSDFCTGNVVMDDTNVNTHAINELNLPLIVMGAKDMIIAATYNGILVSDKHQSSYMKPLVESVQGRPMYEECMWGDYRVLDYVEHVDGTKCLTKRLYVQKGKSISCHLHHHHSDVWTIISGLGEFTLDGQCKKVSVGDVLQIQANAKHTIRAINDLEIIEVQIGHLLTEDDVVYFD
ncbi:MAG: sugar phosphate nucleotidyltransferase [Defluviitaleaceae bacterium]|nr:sugar phosphate nucleotidyltransferase [Defluviitaleaceae bacterium]